MNGDYELVAGTPSVEDYRRLREVAGLSGKSVEAATTGLPNTWYAVTVRHAGKIVAMGRIIGDGGTAFQLTDMAVEPAHQGQGLGKMMMAALTERLKSHAPASAYVSLIADGDASHLYAKYGFEPTMPASIGMYLRVR